MSDKTKPAWALKEGEFFKKLFAPKLPGRSYNPHFSVEVKYPKPWYHQYLNLNP